MRGIIIAQAGDVVHHALDQLFCNAPRWSHMPGKHESRSRAKDKDASGLITGSALDVALRLGQSPRISCRLKFVEGAAKQSLNSLDMSRRF